MEWEFVIDHSSRLQALTFLSEQKLRKSLLRRGRRRFVDEANVLGNSNLC